MQTWNQTGFPHEYTTAMDKDAREHIVVLVKASYDFPDEPDGSVRKSAEQVPLVTADTYTGKPGHSSTYWESDFGFRKLRCDVIANGCAYGPNGESVERVRVGIRIGNWSKLFDVVGDREWRAIGPKFWSTNPQPFRRQPFSYDTAWGGVDRLDANEAKPDCYRLNPVGTGWSHSRNESRIVGLRLPNTQAEGEEIRSPFGKYRPMSFGPVGRGWPGRIEYGGTYDANWAANIFPFLPPDFDDRYFQMAPPDQQIDAPKGGEEVSLVNLTPQARVTFRMPSTGLPITLFRGRLETISEIVFPDTVLLDPENRRFCLVWRFTRPIRRSISDYSECWIGPPTPGMQLARARGKRYVRWNSMGTA